VVGLTEHVKILANEKLCIFVPLSVYEDTLIDLEVNHPQTLTF